MGIEPTLSAWKAEVLPLNYTRETMLVEGEGFEPPKAEPLGLQPRPVDRLGNPSKKFRFLDYYNLKRKNVPSSLSK